ncbi:hypothetical protein [Planctomycetes bacterium TBK1r]|uniref:Phage virion morphogenesis family protein n=1 Tax=Stieleria magnilauensis TaxID=2527963 RepID=A0ABX5XZE1_9BACT|nr:hypothetical protein TBK1r_64350 [Planctomycetes bacterium TBK1r]
MTTAKIRFQGNPVKALRDRVGLAATKAYQETGDVFHRDHKDDRFTETHAKKAGFLPRSGSALDRLSKDFRKSYTGRKLRLKGHTRPLEFTGKTRRSTESHRIDAVSSILTDGDGKGEVQVSYPQAKGFNRKSRHTDIDMRDEFQRVTAAEQQQLGKVFKKSLADNLKTQ